MDEANATRQKGSVQNQCFTTEVGETDVNSLMFSGKSNKTNKQKFKKKQINKLK